MFGFIGNWLWALGYKGQIVFYIPPNAGYRSRTCRYSLSNVIRIWDLGLGVQGVNFKWIQGLQDGGALGFETLDTSLKLSLGP